MSTVDRPITDVDHAFRQIVVGIDVLEGRMARAPEQRSTDDDLLLTSLAFSLERLARETAPSIADPAQRAELALAAARIRAVIDELGAREPAVVEAPTTRDEPEPEAEVVAVAPPEPRWTAGRIRRICGLALLGIGVVLALFLVYEFAFTGFRESRSQRALLPVFEQRLATGTFGDPATPVPSGPVALLQIPSIGVHQVVVQGSSPSELKQGPGHMPGSPLPGEFGNSVILGHNRLYGGPFGGIDSLTKGDQIIAVTGQGRFRYDVEEVVTVAPGDKDVIGAALESRLTLVTSKSPTSSDRVAVIAKLHGDPVAVPQRPQAFAGSDQRGTSGDASGLLLAIIWGALLAATVTVAVRLHAIWPRAAAHLVTTPVILLLLWLIFQSLDLLLPGTM
jgi:sortase A